MSASNDVPSAETVETPTASSAASSASNSLICPSQTPSISHPRTEHPAEPYNLYQPIPSGTEAPIGNPKAALALRLEGQLGVFYNRKDTVRVPTHVEINMTNFRDAAYRVLSSVIAQEMVRNQSPDVTVATIQQGLLADYLADGIVVMAYCKLRNVNYADQRVAGRFRRNPNVPTPFEVPEPYAYAISQLGQIKISGLPRQHYYSPTAPEGADINFCLPATRHWNPATYSEYVELAKKIGIRFASVDLTVKRGSSWWIYRPVTVCDVEELQCPFPEENFTEETALLAMLFCTGQDGSLHNPLVALNAFGDDNYGTMARINIPDIAVQFYYAVIVSSETM